MYNHTDTDTMGNFHIQYRVNGVSKYAVFLYVRFGLIVCVGVCKHANVYNC
jgi:hypothetical protein